jgi:hypothetical protein
MRPIILEDNSISVSNITVSNPTAVQLECLIGKKDNAPGDVTTRLFNYQLTNIICTGKADHHFFFPYAWQGVLTNCRSEGGEQTVGFRFDTGTSTTLNSCLAYSPLGYGFSFKSFNYSTLNSCGVDAGSRGFYFETDNRGMTMNSIGTEGLTDYSVFIEGTGSELIFNAPHFVYSDAVTTDVIRINCSTTSNAVTITNLVTFVASSPASPSRYISLANTNIRPVLINCVLNMGL